MRNFQSKTTGLTWNCSILKMGTEAICCAADFNKRIIRQMENISPFVDKILCYQYIGIMNKPGTDIIAGHPDSLRLYEQYSAWYNQYKNKK